MFSPGGRISKLYVEFLESLNYTQNNNLYAGTFSLRMAVVGRVLALVDLGNPVSTQRHFSENSSLHPLGGCVPTSERNHNAAGKRMVYRYRVLSGKS